MHSTLRSILIVIWSLLASTAWANSPAPEHSHVTFNSGANLYGTKLAEATDPHRHNITTPDQTSQTRKDVVSSTGQNPTEAVDRSFLLLLFLGTAGLISIRRYVNS